MKLALIAGLWVAAALPLPAQRGDAFDTRLRPPTEERALFHLPPGFEIQLVAAEPDIQKPMNLAFDAAGRVWVTGSTLYPWPARLDALGEPIASFQKNWDDNNLAFRATSTPPEPAAQGADTVRILSDFAADGRARRVSTFADGLNIPIGVLPLPRLGGARGDTVLVYSIPAIWRLTDTDGDGRADVREKLYDGFGFKDTHGMSSSYWLWFDGWVYGTHGFANASEVTDRAGRVVKLASGNTYRFRPDGSRFELFAHGQTNPFGLAFDPRGDVYTADSHSKPVYLLIPGGYYEGISREHDGLGFAPAITTDDHGSSAIAGIAHYSATQFPAEFRQNVFNGNPVTRRVNRVRLDWRGSSPHATRQADFLTSDDPAFRPVQVKLGPDGALWIADFYNPIIGHYEVPLTHPSRDRAHGRIWRVIWRGLDQSVPAPALPDLSRLGTAALVEQIADNNLIVRGLALSELLARPDAAAAVPRVRAAAARLVTGADAAADETALLPLLMSLERLGAADDGLLRQALIRVGSDAALAALRVLASRDVLPADAEELFAAVIGTPDSRATLPGSVSTLPSPQATLPRTPPPTAPLQAKAPTPPATASPAASSFQPVPAHAGRVVSEILMRHPQPWGAPLLLGLQARLAATASAKDSLPPPDFELGYAVRLALKAHALTADENTLRAWAAASPAAAERVADVCLAVPTPAAATFLLHHLERTKFAGPRAGDFARHAVLQLPEGDDATVLPLLRSLARAPRPQRLAVAEGLAVVAAKPGRTLANQVEAWMRDELLAALEDKDAALGLRAINALKPLPLPEKTAPLRRVVLDSSTREANRIAALRALTPGAPDAEHVAIEILSGSGSNALRRAAADLLGTANAGTAARAALAAAFPGASADLSLALASGLAKSDAGAAELLDAAAAGKMPTSLLRHRHVALAFEQRPEALRERVAALTRALPPEDARLDALIAQRLGSQSSFQTDAARGAAQFARNCAACHRFRDNGGNVGPSLDGIGSRSVQRIVEDILDPSRNIDPAFRLTTVTLRNGETKSGMNLREETSRVLLTEPATGAETALPRSDVAEISPSPVSPMPAAFETVLSEQEFFDLLEFLRSPAK